MFQHVWTPFWFGQLPANFKSHGAWELEFLDIGKEANLRQRCAVPEDSYCVRLSVEAPLGRDGYTITFFGYRVRASIPETAPVFELLGHPDTVRLVAAHRIVSHRLTAMWLEALWHPVNGLTIGVQGFEQRKRAGELKLIDRGLDILKDLENRQGPPPGMKYFRDCQEFCETMIDIIKLLERNGINPTQPRVAEFLMQKRWSNELHVMSVTDVRETPESVARTLRNYLQDCGCSWRELRQAARSTP